MNTVAIFKNFVASFEDYAAVLFTQLIKIFPTIIELAFAFECAELTLPKVGVLLTIQELHAAGVVFGIPDLCFWRKMCSIGVYRPCQKDNSDADRQGSDEPTFEACHLEILES